MASWLLWVIAGLVLISAEVISGDLWLLMIGIGALGGGLAAALTGNIVLAAVIFAAVSVALVAGIRPTLKRRLLAGPEHKTNTQALIGARAIVVSPVDEHQGQVKIGGEIWSARAEHPDERLAQPGTPVIVMRIAGATAMVAPEP